MRINERGNFIYNDFEADQKLGIRRGESRYGYDQKLCREGWKQYDTNQDAWYFGVWVNVETRQTFTYAEGDRCLVECPTVESFRAELEDAEKFYGPPPPSMITYGEVEGLWTRTEYYDERPMV